MGGARAATSTPFKLTTVQRDIERQPGHGENSSNPGKSSRQNSRSNTPANSPGKNGDGEQAVNGSPTASKEQVDDRDQLIRRGYAVTNYPLVDLYVGKMKDKKRTQVTLTALRPIGKRTHNDTFNQWRIEVKKRLGEEIEKWKKVDGSFVQYEGFTTFSGVPALITEFIEGTPAKEYLEKKSAKEKHRLILEFARALKTLHGQNLSHGNIEPCHFMVDKKGKAKVGGYCFNRMVEEKFEKLYPSEDHRGTTRYVAPEFLENRKTDEHTDVYSFGLVAMELLTGVQPFSSVSQEASLISRVKRGEPPFAEDLAKDDAWRAVLSSCWVKDPGARPSMERLDEEVRAVLSSCWVKDPGARPSMERLDEELSKPFERETSPSS
ncbi:hypothetical protein FRC01_010966 [Tulasnella sp. 417]|nr:hypothetical protein FRC01_010966 [Tulasnella sp. 417]